MKKNTIIDDDFRKREREGGKCHRETKYSPWQNGRRSGLWLRDARQLWTLRDAISTLDRNYARRSRSGHFRIRLRSGVARWGAFASSHGIGWLARAVDQPPNSVRSVQTHDHDRASRGFSSSQDYISRRAAVRHRLCRTDRKPKEELHYRQNS